MPGWFSDHYENMRRYAHLACVGVVVGSQSNGSVKPGFRGARHEARVRRRPTPTCG